MHPHRVLIQQIQGRHQHARPLRIRHVVRALRDGRQDLMEFARDLPADRYPVLIYVLPQRINVHGDLILELLAALVHVEAAVVPARQVTFGGQRKVCGDHRLGESADVAHHVPVRVLLRLEDGVGPELEYSGGDDAHEDDGEQSDVVLLVFQFHLDAAST